MPTIRSDVRMAPFIEPIELSRTSADDLLRIPANKVVLIERITLDEVDALRALIREARKTVAEVYRGQRQDLPLAALVPPIYVLTDAHWCDRKLIDAIANAGAAPVTDEEWDAEIEALRPLLSSD